MNSRYYHLRNQLDNGVLEVESLLTGVIFFMFETGELIGMKL
jgi:hypothetical protein